MQVTAFMYVGVTHSHTLLIQKCKRYCMPLPKTSHLDLKGAFNRRLTLSGSQSLVMVELKGFFCNIN